MLKNGDKINDVTKIDRNMYERVMKILKYHSCVRHIRGGESTRRKFLVKNANL